jgi:hypothetical protein
MAYYEDLTGYTYSGGGSGSREIRMLKIGWLDKEHPYTTGRTSREFRERLKIFCEDPLPYSATWGYHYCSFCEGAQCNTEICIWAGDKEYHAPAMIYHYVVLHGYKPPKEFIDAVMKADLPHTHEYRMRYDFIYAAEHSEQKKRWWKFW